MLSMLYVRLTIKVRVGIPESFKAGWYPHKITGSSHLKALFPAVLIDVPSLLFIKRRKSADLSWHFFIQQISCKQYRHCRCFYQIPLSCTQSIDFANMNQDQETCHPMISVLLDIMHKPTRSLAMLEILSVLGIFPITSGAIRAFLSNIIIFIIIITITIFCSFVTLTFTILFRM